MISTPDPALSPTPQGTGVRLGLADTMNRLPISWRKLRFAIHANGQFSQELPSVTALRRVASTGTWPALMPEARRAEIRSAIEQTLRQAGADDETVETLWQPSQGDPVPPRGPQLWATQRKDLTLAPFTPATAPEEPPMLMAKQTLSPAARKAFSLFANPFDGEVVRDEEMFANGEVAYVREACMQTARSARFTAIVGESGAGKTTILADLEARILRDKAPVIVIKPWVLGMEESDAKGKTLKSGDILSSIITTLDPLALPRQTLEGRSNQAQKILTRSAEAGYDHLLVIEEAHSMPEPTLKHLKRLHEMRLGRKPLLGILLLGQTELGMKLDPRRANLREVTQRCEVVNLLPLDGDLRAYLEHRAKAAGRKLEEFIDETGINEIRARLTITRASGPAGRTSATSLLYPLAVNNLMTAAMNLAAELGAGQVTRDVVRGV